MKSRFGPLALSLALVAHLAPYSLLAEEDGEPDLDFGAEDGAVVWLHPSTGGPIPVPIDTRLRAIATTEERLVAVGQVGGSDGDLFWEEFDADGAPLEPSCYEPSETLFPAAVTSQPFAAIVDATGGLLVGGSAALLGSEQQERALVARFDLDAASCALDDTFSTNGSDYLDEESWCDTEDCAVLALGEVRPATGALGAVRTIALVRSTVNASAARLFLLRLRTSGTIDTAFSGDGWKEILHPSLGALTAEAAMAIDGRGRIVVAVTRTDPDVAHDVDVYALRYSANGVLDTSIGYLGLVRIDDPLSDDQSDAKVSDLEIGAQGVWSVGYHTAYGANFLELDPDADERSWTAVAGGLREQTVVQGDGRVLWTHDSAGDGFRTWGKRIATDPLSVTPDASFDGGSADYDLDLDEGETNAESVGDLVLWHGRPIVGGSVAIGGFIPFPATTGSFLLRAQSSYVFADGFEQGTPAYWSEAPGIVFP